ncbi:hypothetical protein NC797_07050 [Aquibacillus sp. 3ASR75-11]|uniref:Uncharacterized protein n=1 Tax=Terrihalobacillus insolitus TaxID=2950438 RepID=A0A9X3WVU2_9BACI|nr:hypothetical protein [Terrihalobacillus insolitus]MDC3424264.1 hypothetical protein [Terrihalobacillus insolitus]
MIDLLTYKEIENIKDFVERHDSFKLTDICEFLIKNGSSKDTYSSGKLKLYPLVGVYIKEHVPGSLLEMEHIENNVQYSKLEEISIDDEEGKEGGLKDNRELKQCRGQLSLF